MIVRPATTDDAIAMWGNTYSDTLRAVACEDNGELLAIAGIRYSRPAMCFSDIRPELKRSPKTIMKIARQVICLVRSVKREVYALADQDEPTSMNFLAHLGFEHVEGRLFKWPQQ